MAVGTDCTLWRRKRVVTANMEWQTVFAGETAGSARNYKSSACLALSVKEKPLQFNIKLTSLATQFN